METGALTSHLDVAQVVLYAFWLFFFGLLFYLRREDRREGYPLENDLNGKIEELNDIWIPKPKTFKLPHGGTRVAPDFRRDSTDLKAVPAANFPGAPLTPTGNGMLDGVGPGAYAERLDEPELTHDGEPKIVPLRVASDFAIADGDPDPRGMDVIGGDGAVAGTISDVWVDRGEQLIRYLEVDVQGAAGIGSVLVPMPMAAVNGSARKVSVPAILAGQFADVPRVRNPDRVTKLEEDRVSAYFGAGTVYATPDRTEPLI